MLVFLFLFVACYGAIAHELLPTAVLNNTSVVDSNRFSDTPRSPIHVTSLYKRPEQFGFVKNLPNDLLQIATAPFKKKNLLNLSVVAGTTALLLTQDQFLINKAKDIGRAIHLDPTTDYAVAVKVGSTKIVKVPKNINTALYQMGEGGTSMLLAGGLFICGKIRHNNRDLQAASDLTETFIAMGICDQLFKRSFGRQSPFMSTCKGGAWNPFPSFNEYQRNTSNYDGFPSGHLSTMMATVTVLAKNYPEKKWIKPIGYTIMGLTGFAMMNTEVHWAGDYPLALAIGYISGKVTVDRHRKKATRQTEML